MYLDTRYYFCYISDFYKHLNTLNLAGFVRHCMSKNELPNLISLKKIIIRKERVVYLDFIF